MRRLLVCLWLTLPAWTETPRRTNENLNAVLWQQTAAEYRAGALQAYRAATDALGHALRDRRWSALPDQRAARRLPPAVILDIDETVLDNSPFQARMIDRDAGFDVATWNAWVAEAAAAAVPGAVAFTQYAHRRGVAVYYVTNREAASEAATRRNLARLGFPLDDRRDTLLCRGERPEWTSDKGTRRAYLAARHRVMLLVGDDLGDFLSGVRASVEARRALAAPYDGYWGRRWIVLPNPAYGSWEAVLLDGTTTLDDVGTLRRKYELLDRRTPR